MNCLGRFSNIFASEGSPIILPKLGSVFSRTTSFVLKIVILLAFGLGICEGVGEDSGHGIGHIDIRVGSCNYLNVFVCHACALRWGVTHIRNYLYWEIAHPVEGILFQVQEAFEKTTHFRGLF